MNTQILIGTLMGDSSIYKSKKDFYTFSSEHSTKQQKYLEWLAIRLGIVGHIYYRSRYDVRTDKTYHSVILTVGSKFYREYYEMFYPNGKKYISDTILNSLDEQSIAVWYCDDGNIYYNKDICHLTLAVDGFTEEERSRIITYFRSRWNLHFKRNQRSIRLTSVAECVKFFELFGKYIPEEMSYKLLKHKSLIIR